MYDLTNDFFVICVHNQSVVPRHLSYPYTWGGCLEYTPEIFKKSFHEPLLQLLVLKLIGAVFPTSDFQHPVVTPAMLLMAQLLQKVRSIAVICYVHASVTVWNLVEISYLSVFLTFSEFLSGWLCFVWCSSSICTLQWRGRPTMKGIHEPINNCKTLIGVHWTMYSMRPNNIITIITCMTKHALFSLVWGEDKARDGVWTICVWHSHWGT